jgi:two-component system NarL family sensor kinase
MPTEELRIIIVVLFCSMIVLGLAITILSLIANHKKRIFKSKKEIETIKVDFEKKILLAELEIQETTFQKISSEIHDNISLGLTLAKLQINNVIEKKEVCTDKLVLAVDLISKSLVDLNDISKSMDGSQLLEYGLINAIESEVNVLSQTGLYDVEFDILGEPVFLDQKIELAILRIIQEACNNIIKHARANNIRVELYYEITHIKLKIVDNGVGFDPLKVQEKKQIRKMAGLKNIYSRAEIVGGRVEIFSTPERGTAILIHIPLNMHSDEKRTN